MSDEIKIREAGPDDLPVVLHHRRAMFKDMGLGNEAGLAAMSASSESLLAGALADGRYRGWLAELPGGEIVAGGGLWIAPWLSHPRDPQPRRGEILNVYTEPAFRRRGLARRLMGVMIGWCRDQGFPWIMLHASEDGRPLYESLGFQPTNEMRLLLK
jgi:GNAT superfamily N-acetyltransferase